MGDGVLAYFGWPRAHEDDADRAVHGGLAAADAVSRMSGPAGKDSRPGPADRRARRLRLLRDGCTGIYDTAILSIA